MTSLRMQTTRVGGALTAPVVVSRMGRTRSKTLTRLATTVGVRSTEEKRDVQAS
jgi:hypothetical protein